ncbi:hypothetical protein [Pseudomonas eucalypticola]|nr:hypothetical protein [Pseudomonas eucalypticola]
MIDLPVVEVLLEHIARDPGHHGLGDVDMADLDVVHPVPPQ